MPTKLDVALFDASFYLGRGENADLAAAGVITPTQGFAHWFETGLAEGRVFSPLLTIEALFDEAAYAANPQVGADIAAGLAANELDHYIRIGSALDTPNGSGGAQFNPNAFFDPAAYRNANPDIVAAVDFNGNSIDPFVHYLQFGEDEVIRGDRGLDGLIGFDPAFYEDANGDVAGFVRAGPDGNAGLVTFLQHYVANGQFEERAGTSDAALAATALNAVTRIEETGDYVVAEDVTISRRATDIGDSNTGTIELVAKDTTIRNRGTIEGERFGIELEQIFPESGQPGSPDENIAGGFLIENDGVIRAFNGDGIRASAYDGTIINRGVIETVIDPDGARFGFAGGGNSDTPDGINFLFFFQGGAENYPDINSGTPIMTLINEESGIIRAERSAAFLTAGSDVTNHGLIEGGDFGLAAQGFDFQDPVTFDLLNRNEFGFSLINTGTVRATGEDTDDGLRNTREQPGIGLAFFGDLGDVTIDNSGLIEAVADAVLVGDSKSITITNSGTIRGDSDRDDRGAAILFEETLSDGLADAISMGRVSVDDMVTNSGTIEGDVRLGLGDDMFDGAAGTQDRVSGGLGADQIALGAAAETVLIEFEAESSLISLDTVTGFSDDQDVIATRVVVANVDQRNVSAATTAATADFFGGKDAVVEDLGGNDYRVFVDIDGDGNLSETADVALDVSSNAPVGWDSSDFTQVLRPGFFFFTAGDDTFDTKGEVFAVLSGEEFGEPRGAVGGGLFGLEGNDTITGGDGADRIFGGDGNDVIDGGNGINTLEGGDGNDILIGGRDGDSINGGAGNDRIEGNGGQDTILGGEGADTFAFSIRSLVIGDQAGFPSSPNPFSPNSQSEAAIVYDFGLGDDNLDLSDLDLPNPQVSFREALPDANELPGLFAESSIVVVQESETRAFVLIDTDGNGEGTFGQSERDIDGDGTAELAFFDLFIDLRGSQAFNLTEADIDAGNPIPQGARTDVSFIFTAPDPTAPGGFDDIPDLFSFTVSLNDVIVNLPINDGAGGAQSINEIADSIRANSESVQVDGLFDVEVETLDDRIVISYVHDPEITSFVGNVSVSSGAFPLDFLVTTEEFGVI